MEVFDICKVEFDESSTKTKEKQEMIFKVIELLRQ